MALHCAHAARILQILLFLIEGLLWNVELQHSLLLNIGTELHLLLVI